MSKRSRLWPMLIAGLLFAMTIYWMGPLSQQIVGHFWLKQGVTQTIGGSQNPVTYQGMILQEKAMESPDILPIYGSSEFSAFSEFHPSRVFEGKPTGFAPFLVGRGGTQDIIHALNMAALVSFDYLDRKNRTWKFWGKGRWWDLLAILVTLHCVMLGFLIFSGRLV